MAGRNVGLFHLLEPEDRTGSLVPKTAGGRRTMLQREAKINAAMKTTKMAL